MSKPNRPIPRDTIISRPRFAPPGARTKRKKSFVWSLRRNPAKRYSLGGRPRTRLFLGRGDVRNRQIPVGEQYLEAPLFLLLVGRLIGIELFDERFLVGNGGRGQRGILVGDGHAVVPARIFGHVVGRRFDLERQDPSRLLHFLQQREVIFQEKVEKFLLMAPGDLVVVLHGVGFVGGALRRSALGRRGSSAKCQQQKQTRGFHAVLRNGQDCRARTASRAMTSCRPPVLEFPGTTGGAIGLSGSAGVHEGARSGGRADAGASRSGSGAGDHGGSAARCARSQPRAEKRRPGPAF